MAALAFDYVAKHVALYLRISDDPSGLAEGVDVQERLGRVFAAETLPGLPVVVYCDNDLTAADDDVYRPEFERLRADVAAGRVAHVWSVEQTRLCRTYAWFTFAQELERAGIDQVHTRRDGIIPVADLASDVGAVVAIHEVRRMKQRLRDRQDDMAAQGRPSGARVYGYKHVTDEAGRKALEIVPGQAAVIREAAERILDGEPKTAIARDLSARGVRGLSGAEIGANTISNWFRAGTIAGLRVHRGELLRDKVTGELVRGTWAPILDVATWEAVRAKLDVNRGKGQGRGDRPTRRKYLLSGVAYCECGGRMSGSTARRKGREAKPRYLCKACAAGIDATAVEDHVEAKLTARLGHLAARLVQDEHAGWRKEIGRELDIIAERRKLAVRKLARNGDEDAYDTFIAELDAWQAELQAELAALPAAVGRVDTDAVGKAMSVGTVDEKRTIVSTYIQRVVIARARPGASRLTVDLGRVRIVGPGWDD